MSARRRDTMPVAALKVAARLVQERITRATPADLADIPSSAARITPEWMTQVMCRDAAGARVEVLEMLGGTDGTHERKRIGLRYNDAGRAAGLPPSVFTKTLPSLTTRMLVGYMGHARYEMLFYTRIRPELRIETPVCYHSASDKRSFAAVHVIEDLAASKRARFGDETLVLTRPQAEDLVDLLAELHGTFLGSPRLVSGDLKWLVRYHDWFTIGVERVHTDRYCEKATTKAARLVPARLLARRAEIWPAAMRALDIHRGRPLTVIHSDVHVANWYVTGEGRMGLLDWQCVTAGHWARDLAYALATCLPIENRRLWERELVARYAARLSDRAGSRITFDEAWLGYRQQMLHALMMWTQTLCHPIFQPNSQRDELTYALLERCYVAIDDLDSLDACDERLAA